MLREQIPALRDESNQEVVSGPIDIAQRLRGRYPTLFPANEVVSIQEHIKQLNGLDWFSLSLPVPQTQSGETDRLEAAMRIFQERIEQRLENGASAWYRAALMYRIRTYADDHGSLNKNYLLISRQDRER